MRAHTGARPARRAGLRRFDPHAQSAPLVAAGWIEVGPGDDERSRTVWATDAGRKLRSEGQKAWKQAQLALNERLGVERVVALHALLDDCMQRLEEQEPAQR